MSTRQSTSSGSSLNPVAERRAIRVSNSQKRAKGAENLRLQGNDRFMNGDWVGAADLYAQAINVHGPKPVILSNLAASYLKLELYDEAEWAATTSLEYDPSSIKARYRRAMARKNLSRYKSAKIDFQYMLAQDPGNQTAKDELRSIEMQMKTDPGLPKEPYEDQPRYDDQPWALVSESETEDCKHVGNYMACRFYNHGGCKRGIECNFSHAPDAKSVRDETGRNVCLHFLMSDCTFGGKCVYSHSRKYLPERGWWDDPVQLQAAKTTLPYVDDFADHRELHDLLLEHPKARTYASLQEREAVLDHLKRQHSEAKRTLAQRKTAPTTKPETPDSFVLVLSFDWEPAFAEMHSHLFAELAKKINAVHIRTSQQASQALEYLDSPSLVSVLITDIGITKRESAKVLNKLIAYVKNGGSATIGGVFASFIRPLDFAKFMKTAWGFDWKMGSYTRSVFSLNTSNEVVKHNPSLTKSYSMKSVHVAGIKPEMAIYCGEYSNGEAPAISAPVGRGRLCILGDVNEEQESTNTVLAMLGVLDQWKKPTTKAQTSKPSSDVQRTKSESAKDGKKEVQELSQAQVLNAAETQMSKIESAKDGKSADAEVPSSEGESSKTTNFVLLLELEGDSHVRQKFSHQLSNLASKISVMTAYNAREAVTLLRSPNLQGVYVIDEGIEDIENTGVLFELGRHARSGGSVVFGGLFGLDIDNEAMSAIFSTFGLRWSMGSFCKCEAQQNRHHDTSVRNPGLSDAYYMKAVHLRGFHPEELFYEQYFDEYDNDEDFVPPGGDAWEAPILRSRVGNGHVGYIGDVTPEPESTDVLLSMLELLTPPKALEPDSKKFIIMLTGFAEDMLQKYIPDFMQDLRGKVEVITGLSTTGLSNARIIDLLSSKDLVGVLVGDSVILFPENAYLLSKLVEYSKGGGTLVFGWHFCNIVTTTQFRPLFRDNWGLNWDMAGRTECGVKRNFENPLFKGKRSVNLKLSKKTRFEGILINGIMKTAAVYIPLTRPNGFWNPEKGIYKAAVVFTEIEKGHLGYIGSPNVDGEGRDIIYTMFGLT